MTEAQDFKRKLAQRKKEKKQEAQESEEVLKTPIEITEALPFQFLEPSEPSLEQRLASPFLFTSPVAGDIITTDAGELYTISEKLGQGGEGTSYLALDAEKRKKVLKMLKVPQTSMAWKEIEKLKTSTPRVNAALDLHMEVASLNSVRYLVISDYVEGEDTRSLSARKAFSEEETVTALADILEHDLGALHTRKLVHGDIIPANIIQLPEAEAEKLGKKYRLIDFGVVREEHADLTVTVTSNIRESLSFHKPGTLHSQQGDLYSLARTAYHLLMGSSPLNINQPDQETEEYLAQKQFSKLPCSEELQTLLLEMQGYGEKTFADYKGVLQELKGLQGLEVEKEEIKKGERKIATYSIKERVLSYAIVSGVLGTMTAPFIYYLQYPHLHPSDGRKALYNLAGASIGVALGALGTFGYYKIKSALAKRKESKLEQGLETSVNETEIEIQNTEISQEASHLEIAPYSSELESRMQGLAKRRVDSFGERLRKAKGDLDAIATYNEFECLSHFSFEEKQVLYKFDDTLIQQGYQKHHLKTGLVKKQVTPYYTRETAEGKTQVLIETDATAEWGRNKAFTGYAYREVERGKNVEEIVTAIVTNDTKVNVPFRWLYPSLNAIASAVPVFIAVRHPEYLIQCLLVISGATLATELGLSCNKTPIDPGNHNYDNLLTGTDEQGNYKAITAALERK